MKVESKERLMERDTYNRADLFINFVFFNSLIIGFSHYFRKNNVRAVLFTGITVLIGNSIMKLASYLLYNFLPVLRCSW